MLGSVAYWRLAAAGRSGCKTSLDLGDARVLSCGSMEFIRMRYLPRGPSGRRRRPTVQLAFSLTELLVVLAVIGVLAALLLAWVAPATKKARQARCAQNVGQLGRGVQVFVTDSHVYPLYSNPRYGEGSYPEHQTDWCAALQGVLARGDPVREKVSANPYQTGLWLCPSALPPASAPASTGFRSYGYNGYGLNTDSAPGTVSFGLGGHYGWNAGPDGSMGPPVRESEVARPSMMMVLGDGLEGGKGIIVDGLMVLRRNDGMPVSPGTTARAIARHTQRANVAFADGHVDSLRLKSLFEENSDAALSRWNRDDRPHPELLTE